DQVGRADHHLARDAAPVGALAADQAPLHADHREAGLGELAGDLLAPHAEPDDHDVDLLAHRPPPSRPADAGARSASHGRRPVAPPAPGGGPPGPRAARTGGAAPRSAGGLSPPTGGRPAGVMRRRGASMPAPSGRETSRFWPGWGGGRGRPGPGWPGPRSGG